MHKIVITESRYTILPLLKLQIVYTGITVPKTRCIVHANAEMIAQGAG